MSEGLRYALVQHDIVWEDRNATLTRLAPRVATAAAGGARLVVLTEMFAVGFSMNTDAIAEPVGGPTSQWLVSQAMANGVWVCGSAPEKGEGAARPWNQFMLAGPDGSVQRYAKVHPFSFAGEDQHFEAGTSLATFDVDGVRVTPFVCYDLRFADEFWATAAATDLYVVVANWPDARRAHWRALLEARAIENQAYVAGVNRVGEGGGLGYAGDSRLVDPMGEVLVAGASTETILVSDVDPAVVAETRARLPFLQDRR